MSPDPADPDSLELVPDPCQTALGAKGRYFAGPTGVNHVTCPLEVQHLAFEDLPSWTPIHPWLVSFSPMSLVGLLREVRRDLRRAPQSGMFAPSRRERQAAVRRARDYAWLIHQVIGRRLWRVIARVPVSARPYMLAWLSVRSQHYAQLLHARPLLAVALAHHAVDRVAVESGEDLLRFVEATTLRPLRVLEGLVGIPGCSPGIAKVSPAASDPVLLPGLQAALKNPETRKVFDHLPTIGPNAILFLARGLLDRVVTPRFLHQLATRDRRKLWPDLADAMDVVLLLTHFPDCPPFSSPAQLIDRWQQVRGEFSKAELKAIRGLGFPPAEGVEPLPGLEQIRTGAELLAEAAEMQNCLANRELLDALTEGRLVLFRVRGLGHQRTIVAADRLNDGRYLVTEIRGRRNAHASPATVRALAEWALSQGMLFMVGIEGQRRIRQLSFDFNEEVF